jgi:hypothetical protein
MRRLLSRTSITIDEAVAILLGRITGPIDLEPIDDSEEAEANSPAFDLQETLEDELDVLDGEYRLAKHERQSEDVIAEKLAAQKEQEAVIDKANGYLCEIEDEINKGEQSILKLDRALSNTAYTFITLHSFNEWQKQRSVSSEVKSDHADFVGAESAPPKGHKNEKKVRDKMRRQERAILDAIVKLGYDAKAVPKFKFTEAGAKAQVWDAVQNLGLFDNYDIFDKAWERLRKGKDILDAAPPPHKKV